MQANAAGEERVGSLSPMWLSTTELPVEQPASGVCRYGARWVHQRLRAGDCTKYCCRRSASRNMPHVKDTVATCPNSGTKNRQYRATFRRALNSYEGARSAIRFPMRLLNRLPRCQRCQTLLVRRTAETGESRLEPEEEMSGRQKWSATAGQCANVPNVGSWCLRRTCRPAERSLSCRPHAWATRCPGSAHTRGPPGERRGHSDFGSHGASPETGEWPH